MSVSSLLPSLTLLSAAACSVTTMSPGLPALSTNLAGTDVSVQPLAALPVVKPWAQRQSALAEQYVAWLWLSPKLLTETRDWTPPKAETGARAGCLPYWNRSLRSTDGAISP